MDKPATEEFTAVINHLEQELVGIRTGRANPALVEDIKVEAYGASMPVVQLASVAVQDARTITIQPWDKALLKNIEQGIQKSDIGLTPVNDGTMLRLTIPALTEDRRKEYIKMLNGKLEQARVAIRMNREERLREMKEKKQDGTLSENEFFMQQKELQKEVDRFVAIIEEHGTKKENEIMTI